MGQSWRRVPIHQSTAPPTLRSPRDSIPLGYGEQKQCVEWVVLKGGRVDCLRDEDYIATGDPGSWYASGTGTDGHQSTQEVAAYRSIFTNDDVHRNVSGLERELRPAT